VRGREFGRGRRNKMKNKKRVITILIILLVVIFGIAYSKFQTTGKSIVSQKVTIIPLSSAEIEKVATTILSSEFIKDVPKKYPIALRFFDFESGQKRWRDGFLIGKNQLLLEGEPAVYLSLHSKYISELNNANFCEIIKRANENRDLGFDSEYNKASLFIKYSGMLKHRECFGF